jgi:hypothetical protein
MVVVDDGGNVPGFGTGGYGVGGYGAGGYGIGVAPPSGTGGSPIAASDWTLDNWNATLMACPAGGGIYAWTPNTGFNVPQLVSGNDAPAYRRRYCASDLREDGRSLCGIAASRQRGREEQQPYVGVPNVKRLRLGCNVRRFGESALGVDGAHDQR